MRPLFYALIVVLVSSCSSGSIQTLESKLYANVKTDNKLDEQKELVGNLKERGIVVFRVFAEDYGKAIDPSKKIFTLFHEIEENGEHLKGISSNIAIKLFNGKYVALALDPGNYQLKAFYVEHSWNPKGEISEPENIEFDITSNEAIYLGDIVLSLHPDQYEEVNPLIGARKMQPKSDVSEFNVEIQDDSSAATEFYQSLNNKPDLKLTPKIIQLY